jgi:Icc-related predicted phosphoesterase
MKICLISDVHGQWNKLTIPECDLLISAGDYSFRGEQHMVKDFHKWLDKQPAKNIISLQGNHEKWVETNFQLAKDMATKECPRVNFIDEGLVEIEGLKIWCSAITPYFCNWAWNRYRGDDIKKHWDRIPIDTDILVTHGPAFGILDKVEMLGSPNCGENVGCVDLKIAIDKLTKLKYHVFGHIHNMYGMETEGSVTYINASICDDDYKPKNAPIVITEL